jgi:autotransporter-associated beta strand protein
MSTPFLPHSSIFKNLFCAASVLALAAAGGNANAANFTYTNGTNGTTQWSVGTGWSATPVSASDTTLDFSANQTTGITTTSNNDISGNFTLNRLNITNIATANGTAPVLIISGNALAFTSNGATAPTLVFGQSNGNATTVRPSVTISNDIILNNSLTISNPNASNQATLSGVISGSGGLNKTSGQGGVNITGTNNSFSGAVVISANGSLSAVSIGNTGANSSLGTNGTITIGGSGNSGTLTWTGTTETTDKIFSMGGSSGNATISASTVNQTLTISQNLLISGNGTKSLILTGAGNIAFNGSIPNGTSPNTSVISVTKSGAGTATLNGTNSYTGGTTITSGTLQFNNSSALGTGAVSLTGTLSALANATLTNNITVATAGTLRVGTGNTFTSSGVISGNGSITKNSQGTLDLSSATSSSFSGGMKIDDGTVVVSAIGNSGSNSALGTNGTIQLGAGTSVGGIRWVGTADETTNKVIDFKSTTSTSSGGTITANGTGLALTFTSNTTATGIGNKTFTLRGDGNINFNGVIANGVNATISLTKSDTGTVTLGAANTYTGNTLVNTGTLLVNGSTSANSTVTVSSGATLGGSGIINGAVLVNGTLSPGAAATVTLGSTLSLRSGSNIAFTLNSTSSKIAFTSATDNLIGSGNATLALTLGTGFDYNSSYTIFQNTTTAGFVFSDITGYDNSGYTASFADLGSDYTLTFTAVPEPATWLLVIAGLGVFIVMRRSRKLS